MSSAPNATSMRDIDEQGVIWSSSQGQISNAGLYLVCFLTCWLILPIVIALWRAVSTAVHRYVLTDQRLREGTGILLRETEETELYRVKDISVVEPLFYKLFGRGTVVLRTSDQTSPLISLTAIANPRGVADAIRGSVERCRVAKGVREIDT